MNEYPAACRGVIYFSVGGDERRDAQRQPTLTNDDVSSTGTVSVSDAILSEGNSGTQLATFTVTRTGGTAAFAVNYATADGTALAGSDYVSKSGTLSFGPNVNSQ